MSILVAPALGVFAVSRDDRVSQKRSGAVGQHMRAWLAAHPSAGSAVWSGFMKQIKAFEGMRATIRPRRERVVCATLELATNMPARTLAANLRASLGSAFSDGERYVRVEQVAVNVVRPRAGA